MDENKERALAVFGKAIHFFLKKNEGIVVYQDGIPHVVHRTEENQVVADERLDLDGQKDGRKVWIHDPEKTSPEELRKLNKAVEQQDYGTCGKCKQPLKDTDLFWDELGGYKCSCGYQVRPRY